ncbi:hypothetical protein EDB19DRAFT_1908925 [Suillus lakei]|nr:hypothetical protein EDB19DRAFT_1908925 [Suillus lakei]
MFLPGIPLLTEICYRKLLCPLQGDNSQTVLSEYYEVLLSDVWNVSENVHEVLLVGDWLFACAPTLLAADPAGEWGDLGEFPENLQWEALIDVLRGCVKIHMHCYETVDLDDFVCRIPLAPSHTFNAPSSSIDLTLSSSNAHGLSLSLTTGADDIFKQLADAPLHYQFCLLARRSDITFRGPARQGGRAFCILHMHHFLSPIAITFSIDQIFQAPEAAHIPGPLLPLLFFQLWHLPMALRAPPHNICIPPKDALQHPGHKSPPVPSLKSPFSTRDTNDFAVKLLTFSAPSCILPRTLSYIQRNPLAPSRTSNAPFGDVSAPWSQPSTHP